MSQPPLVVVAGAAGRFGRCAVDAFAGAGWRVLALSRSPATARPRHPRVAFSTTPLGDTAALVREAVGARAVVHAINPPLPRWGRDALPLLDASTRLALGLQATLMLPGNVYAFGESMPPRLDEATPERPSTGKGAIRQAMEAALRERAGDGLDSVVLRAGDFFGGSGTGNWFDQAIVKPIAQGKLVYPGPLDRAHAWAYLPDFARAFVAVASLPRAVSPQARRLHFAGHTVTGAELLDGLEQAAQDIGLPAPARGWRRSGMPWPLIRAVGLVVPTWRSIAEMAYLWRVPHALDGRALQDAVGTLRLTPLRQALAESLQALGLGRLQTATSLS